MFKLIKNLLLGRFSKDNFKIKADVTRHPSRNHDSSSICIFYKNGVFADVRFTWLIGTNRVTCKVSTIDYIPYEVISKVLDYIYIYFTENGELLPTILTEDKDKLIQLIMSRRGTKVVDDNTITTDYILHDNPYGGVSRYDSIMDELPALHHPQPLDVLYYVTDIPLELELIKPTSNVDRASTNWGVKLFPRKELAVLDYVANQSTFEQPPYKLYVYKTKMSYISRFRTTKELADRQMMYDAHVTRAILSLEHTPCEWDETIFAEPNLNGDMKISAYANSIMLDYSNPNPTLR